MNKNELSIQEEGLVDTHRQEKEEAEEFRLLKKNHIEAETHKLRAATDHYLTRSASLAFDAVFVESLGSMIQTGVHPDLAFKDSFELAEKYLFERAKINFENY